MRRLTIAILLLTLNPVTVQPNQPQEARTVRRISSAPMTPGHKLNREQEQNLRIRALICAYSIKYNVEPAFAMAVAHIESAKNGKEFRVGRMGRTYYGPMGIHRCFLNKWAIDNAEVNIEVGVRALSGVGYDEGRQRNRLKRYNSVCDEGYLRAITQAKTKYRKGGVSDGIGNDKRRRFIPD